MLYSTVTPSPTGLVNRSYSLAGVVVAGVLVPVIVLCLLAAIAVAVIVVIYRRGLCDARCVYRTLAIRILQEIKE